MKRPIFLLMLPLFIISGSVLSQQSSLTIYNYYSEKSRDSHSSTENIAISANAVSYSIKYSGRRGPNQTDEEKTCLLTTDQLEKINKTIKDKHLDITDSVMINDNPHNSGYQLNATIIITLVRSGKTTRTKCKGNPADLTKESLYNNSLYLFRMIKGMVDLCR